jgi:hypothetical protein
MPEKISGVQVDPMVRLLEKKVKIIYQLNDKVSFQS